MGPLVRVTYIGLTQLVFRLDRVKSSSCDCPEKIPVDSSASWFTCFSSGVSSPEVAEFCLTLRLVYFIARAYASTCALSSVYSLPCDKFVQKVVPQVKKLSVTAFKDLYVSQVPKNPIVISTGSSPGPGTCFHVGFEVYSSTPRLLP